MPAARCLACCASLCWGALCCCCLQGRGDASVDPLLYRAIACRDAQQAGACQQVSAAAQERRRYTALGQQRLAPPLPLIQALREQSPCDAPSDTVLIKLALSQAGCCRRNPRLDLLEAAGPGHRQLPGLSIFTRPHSTMQACYAVHCVCCVRLPSDTGGLESRLPPCARMYARILSATLT